MTNSHLVLKTNVQIESNEMVNNPSFFLKPQQTSIYPQFASSIAIICKLEDNGQFFQHLQAVHNSERCEDLDGWVGRCR
jgi:hypothetical protein